jgi:hypothetical protein
MKRVFTGILLASMGIAIVSCSSTSTAPGADSTTGAAANSNAAADTAAQKAASLPEPAAPVVKMIAIPAETPLEVVLDGSLASNKSTAGDKFEASLATPLVIEGATVLEKGTKFHGHVVAAEGSGRVKGLANIALVLTDVVHEGKTTPITTKNWAMQAKSTKKKDAAKIGIAAGVGTAIGAIAGGGSGAAKGAAIGGGAGTGVVLATKGDEVELGPETKMTFKLEKPFEVTAPKKG